MFKPRHRLTSSKKRRGSSEESESEKVIEKTGEKDPSSDGKRKKSGIAASIYDSKPVSVPERPTSSPDIILNADDALRYINTDADVGAEARAQYERNRDIQKRIESGELEEGVYRGQKAYRAYIPPDDERKAITAKITGAYGPNRSMASIKTTSRFDYQMDICKDFKETGYCGFGDSCIFLHDRSEFKSGWELEREWDQKQKQREAPRPNEDGEGEKIDEASICCICKNTWDVCETAGCVTQCKHYHCERCFLQNSVIACAVCGKATHGIFNSIRP